MYIHVVASVEGVVFSQNLHIPLDRNSPLDRVEFRIIASAEKGILKKFQANSLVDVSFPC
jgi:hypothetical protein